MDGTAPAMWRHVENVYNQMEAEAELQEVEGREVLVWEGFMTHLTAGQNIPVPYYGRVLAALTRMECITQLRRGGGRSASQWVLWKKPELDNYYEPDQATLTARQGKLAEVEQRVKDIEARLQGVDIGKALADLQMQINRLGGKDDRRDTDTPVAP